MRLRLQEKGVKYCYLYVWVELCLVLIVTQMAVSGSEIQLHLIHLYLFDRIWVLKPLL